MTVRMVMCEPTFLPALSSERTWTHGAANLCPETALTEWRGLVHLINEHVGAVEEMTPEPWAPAMTFTRDLALSVDDVVVPLMPHLARGPFEAPLARRHLLAIGCDLTESPHPLYIDGGNILADSHGRLLVGVTGNEPSTLVTQAARFLEDATGRPAYRVPLAGMRYPHIDMALSDLNGRAWVAYPDALAGFDPQDTDWRDLLRDLPVIVADRHDAELLGCNLVVHGDLVIGPDISTSLRQQIESHGLHYIGTPLRELCKAGGAARCLTLPVPPAAGNAGLLPR